jgi:hypothetical protein
MAQIIPENLSFQRGCFVTGFNKFMAKNGGPKGVHYCPQKIFGSLAIKKFSEQDGKKSCSLNLSCLQGGLCAFFH